MQFVDFMSQMTNAPLICLVIPLIQLTYGLNPDDSHRSKHPRYEFILHKCTASAQLDLKHKTKEATNANGKISISKGLVHETYTSSTMQEEDSVSPEILSTPHYTHFKSTSNSYPSFKINRVTTTIRSYLSKDVQNTPVGTLNIKSIGNVFPTFTKKNLLPILGRFTAEITNSSQSVLVIKTAV